MSDTAAITDTLAAQELESTSKTLTLPVGVYAFSVQGGAAEIAPDAIAVPALQLGLAPMRSQGVVEFLAGAGTLDRWLTRASDSFIVRVTGGGATLLLTSIRYPASSVLTINVQRIDAPPGAAEQESQPLATGNGIVPAQILAHIENFGDIYFGDGRVGFAGQNLRIEAFAILSVGRLEPDLIEYSGIMADGYETPWLSNQVLCGSRGRGMALTGFGIRLKPEIAGRYDCKYTGRFLSGATVGPLEDGAICRSGIPGDSLESFELQVVARHSPSETVGSEN